MVFILLAFGFLIINVISSINQFFGIDLCMLSLRYKLALFF